MLRTLKKRGMINASKVPPTPTTPRRRWPIEAIAGLGMVIVAVIVGLVTRQHQPPPATTNHSKVTVTSTPLSYSNFIGQVKSIDGQRITVLFRGTDPEGRPMEKTYQVTIDQATELKTVQAGENTNAIGALVLADLQPESTVLIAGADNLADISAFTATKLFAYRN